MAERRSELCVSAINYSYIYAHIIKFVFQWPRDELEVKCCKYGISEFGKALMIAKSTPIRLNTFRFPEVKTFSFMLQMNCARAGIKVA